MARKSTNVRKQAISTTVLGGALRLLGLASPRAAAALAARIFFRTPARRPTSAAEAAVLASGNRSDLDRGDRRLATWTWGATGPAVLLVHGWGGSAAQMTPFVEALREAGIRVVAFDGPGHGESAGRSASIPAFADAIARVAGAVGPLAGVVAHSMGGPAFSLAAARGLDAGTAVFVGPPSDAAAWVREFARALDLSPRVEPLLRARIEALAGERIDRLNARALGPALRMPLLVVHDRDDREVPIADGKRVAADAADGRLHATAGLGHRRILRDPGVVERTVRFVASRAA